MQKQTAADGNGAVEAYGREILDLFDELQPGDRVLWGDRKVPCVVARVVDAEDRIGQSLTAGVVRLPKELSDRELSREETPLENGDVFITPSRYGMAGKKFVLIQGPRGGFYAIVKTQRRGRTYPALFRAVRTYHQTRHGRKGQGSFVFEQWFDDTLRVVGHGEPPEVLDEGGDLPKYVDIKDRRVMHYHREDRPGAEGTHHVVGTVEEVFDEGLHDAFDRVRAEMARDPADDDEASPWDDVPPADDVTRDSMASDGSTYGTVTVTGIFESEYGLKAALDTPAPWECPDEATPVNDVLKDTPWDETHRQWDPDREAWTIDADELSHVAYELAYEGYAVVDEAERGG